MSGKETKEIETYLLRVSGISHKLLLIDYVSYFWTLQLHLLCLVNFVVCLNDKKNSFISNLILLISISINCLHVVIKHGIEFLVCFLTIFVVTLLYLNITLLAYVVR